AFVLASGRRYTESKRDWSSDVALPICLGSGLSLAEQALVVALFHLCVDLFNCGQGYTNHNEDRCTTEWEVLVSTDQHECDQRQHRDQAEVEGTNKGHPGDHVFQVLHGGATSANTWDEPALAFHIVGDVLRIERDGHIEVREEDRHEEEHDHVQRVCTGTEVLLQPDDPSCWFGPIGGHIELDEDLGQHQN